MNDPHRPLSAREREVLEILFRLRRASAREVRRQMTDAPADATVRSTLRVLEEKGWVRHEREGRAFYYSPLQPRESVKRAALRHMVRTYFDDSTADLVSTLVQRRSGNLSEEDRLRIEEILSKLDGEDGG
jgi:predicted transcriptional regulator